MKTIKFFTLTVLLSSFFISCSKDKDEPQPEPKTVYVCQDTRYTGANCDQQKTPKKVFLTKLVVTGFEQYKMAPNTPWDGCCDIGDGRPELQLNVFAGTSSYRFGTNFLTDANFNQRYEFVNGISSTLPIELTDPDYGYYVRVSDVDAGASNDIMADVHFTPYHSTNGFPNILYVNTGNTTMEIHLSYEF